MKKEILVIYSVLMLIFAIVVSFITIYAREVYSDYYGEEPSESSISFHSTAPIPPAALFMGSAVGMVFTFVFGEKNRQVTEKSGKVGTYCKDNRVKFDLSYAFNTVGILVGAFSIVALCIYDIMFSKLLK